MWSICLIDVTSISQELYTWAKYIRDCESTGTLSILKILKSEKFWDQIFPTHDLIMEINGEGDLL